MTLRPDSAEVRFVLGELSEEERVAFEEKYFADDQLFHELLEIETDLVDAYVRGELTPAERKRFQAALERVPARREKVRFARALHRSRAPSARRDFPQWRRSPVLPLAAAVLLFAAGTAWFALESKRTSDERARIQSEKAQLAVSMRQLEQQADELRGRLSELESRVKAPGLARGIVSFVLVAGSTRGGSASNELHIPGTAEAVVIQTSPEGTRHPAYEVAIQKPSGETIFTQRGLKAKKTTTGPAVEVVLSSEALPPGDYILVLSGAKPGRTETVGEFAFRVTRNP